MSGDEILERERSESRRPIRSHTDKTIRVGRSMKDRVWDEIRGYLEALVIAYLVVTFVFTTVGVSGTSMEPTLNGGRQGDSLVQTLLRGDRVFIPKYETWLRRLGVLGAYNRGDIVVLREPQNAPSALLRGGRRFYIKRVIGVPGDRIRIVGGQVFINGAPLDQTFIISSGEVDIAPIDFPKVLVENQEVVAVAVNFRPTQKGISTPDLPLAHEEPPSVPLADPRVQQFYGSIVDGLTAPPAGAADGTMVLDFTVPEGEYFLMGDNQSRYGSEDSRYFGTVPLMSIAGRATAVIWPLFREGEWNARLLRTPKAFEELRMSFGEPAHTEPRGSLTHR